MKRLVLLAALAIPSCVVVVDDDNKRRTPPPDTTDRTPPPDRVTVSVNVAWEDCRTVIYREYYGFDWETAGGCEFYVRQYGYDESDMLVLAYIAACARVDIHEVAWQYERCRFDLFQVALTYRLSGDEFFVDIPSGERCPSVYSASYDRFWRRERGYVLTNEECRALVELRIAVHFYGWTHREWFERYERCVTTGRPCREVFVTDYSRCGRGGRDYGGGACVTRERPWTSARDRDACRGRRDDGVRIAVQAHQARERQGQGCATRRPPQATSSVSITVAWEDCRTVILREFFAFDWNACGTIELYARDHGYDDGDLFVLAFIAAWCRVDLHDVVWMYERCRFSLFQVALTYRMTGDEFFVAIPADASCPAPYGRAYGFYWNRQRGYQLTNAECRALVELRIAANFWGWTHRDWFDRYEKCAKAGRPAREAFVAEHARCGQGKKDYRGSACVTRERPWTGRAERDACARQRDDACKGASRAYEDRKRTGRCATQRPPKDDEHDRRHEEEARRKKEEDDRRRADEEVRRRDEEEARRREEDRRRADEEARKRADEEARRRDDERRRADEEARRRDEERRRADEEARREEEARKLDEDRRKREEEARKRADEERRRREEEEDRKKDEAERKKAEEERKAARDKVDRGRRFVADLCAAIELYYREQKNYPEEGAAGLVRCLKQRARSGRPYFEFDKDQCDARGQAVDPWGRPIVFKVHAHNFPKNKNDRGARNKLTFDLCSHGADGRDDDGAGDDIANWDERTERDCRRKCEEEEDRQLKQKKEDDERKAKAEEQRRRDEEERRVREEEAHRKAEEERRRKDEEARRKAEEERKKKDEERKRAEEEARKKAEEGRKKEEERRKADEEARKRAEEERKKKEAEEARRRAEEERRKKEEEARKKAEEDEARKKAEDEAKKKGDEAKKTPTDAERVAKTRKLVDDLCAAIAAYHAERKAYPPSGAASLVKALEEKKKSGEPFFKFEAETLDKDRQVIDAFGRPLHYQNNAPNWPKNKLDKKAFNKRTFDLASFGPNGGFNNGSQDDIANWDPMRPNKDD